MSTHARLSLGWSGHWMICKAWPRKVEALGREESPTVQFRDDAESKLTSGLLEGVSPNGSKPIPAKPDMSEADCAAVAYDYAQKRWLEMGVDSTTLVPEPELQITSTGRVDMIGSPNVLIFNQEMLEIILLKTGPGTYICERNSSSLKLYAIAAMETYNTQPPLIRLTIVQPRYYGEEDTIRTLETTPKELLEWLDCAVMPAANAADDPAAPGTVTENCKKCAARHTCEFRDREVAHSIGGDGFMTTHEVKEIDIRTTQDHTIYDNPRLAQTLLLVPVIRDYCDALEEHALDIIRKGEIVPGFKAVATKGKAKWMNEDAVKEAVTRTKIAKLAYNSKLKTPKQVLALAGISKDLKAKLDDLISTGSGGVDLVMDSDPRESIVPQFKPVDQTQSTAAAPAPDLLPLPDFLN